MSEKSSLACLPAGSRRRSIHSQVVIEFPLTDTLMVLAPFFALYIHIVLSVGSTERVAQHLIVFKAVGGFRERSWQEAALALMQFLFGPFVEGFLIAGTGVDFILDPVEAAGEQSGDREIGVAGAVDDAVFDPARAR